MNIKKTAKNILRPFYRFAKRRPWWTIVIVLVLLFGVSKVLGGSHEDAYSTAIVQKVESVKNIISTTGQTTSADMVSLAFETSGKVSKIYVHVGQTVKGGAVLARLSNGDLAAQLDQARSSVDSARAQLENYRALYNIQLAKLDELKNGARSEDLQISQTKLDNAKKTLADAIANLEIVQGKVSTDLKGAEENITSAWDDAYLVADDIINQQMYYLFTSGGSTGYQLSFQTGNFQSKIDSESGREKMDSVLIDMKKDIDGFGGESYEYAIVSEKLKTGLLEIKDFLSDIGGAVDFAIGISDATLTSYRASINAARTSIASTTATIDNQKQALDLQYLANENGILAAQSQITSAQSAVTIAENELSLKKAGATSEQARIQEGYVDQARSNISSQEAQIRYAEASVRAVQSLLGKSTIYAPVAGTVGKIDIKEGEIASAYQGVITLISQSQLQVETQIPEADIAYIAVGNTANITLDAYGEGISFGAKVVSIDQAETVVSGVVAYKTVLYFDNDDQKIRSGMTANVDILADSREGVLAIPQRAVITKNGQKIVQVLVDKKPQDRLVITGLKGSDGMIELLGGLEENDVVIIGKK